MALALFNVQRLSFNIPFESLFGMGKNGGRHTKRMKSIFLVFRVSIKQRKWKCSVIKSWQWWVGLFFSKHTYTHIYIKHFLQSEFQLKCAHIKWKQENQRIEKKKLTQNGRKEKKGCSVLTKFIRLKIASSPSEQTNKQPEEHTKIQWKAQMNYLWLQPIWFILFGFVFFTSFSVNSRWYEKKKRKTKSSRKTGLKWKWILRMSFMWYSLFLSNPSLVRDFHLQKCKMETISKQNKNVDCSVIFVN